MSLRIISADDRLREAQGKTTMALFGPSGAGKTTLLKTLPPAETLCIDLEAVSSPFRTGRATASRSGVFPTRSTSPA